MARAVVDVAIVPEIEDNREWHLHAFNIRPEWRVELGDMIPTFEFAVCCCGGGGIGGIMLERTKN
jgi:hypothetical protein